MLHHLPVCGDGRELLSQLHREWGELGGEDMPALLGAGIVVGMLIPDIIMKMVMKRDITAMDDYVKSRPVPEKIWNKFLLTTNLVSFWNYVLPVLMLPVFIYFLPAGQVIASFFLFLAFSYIDGIYITCYRKATEWILKWPLILGWMGMFAVLIGYMFVASFFPVWMGWVEYLLPCRSGIRRTYHLSLSRKDL